MTVGSSLCLGFLNVLERVSMVLTFSLYQVELLVCISVSSSLQDSAMLQLPTRLPVRIAVRKRGIPLPAHCRVVVFRALLQNGTCWISTPGSLLGALWITFHRKVSRRMCHQVLSPLQVGPGKLARWLLPHLPRIHLWLKCLSLWSLLSPVSTVSTLFFLFCLLDGQLYPCWIGRGAS